MGDSEFNNNVGNFFKNEEMHLGIAQSPRRIKERIFKFPHMKIVVVMEMRRVDSCKAKDISQLGSHLGCG